MVSLGAYSAASGINTPRCKKKLRTELKRYFPSRFGPQRSLNELSRLKQYLQAQLRAVLNPGPDSAAALNLQFALVVGQHKPIHLRDDPKNTIVGMEKGWTKLCVTLTECGCPDPERLTVFQLYTWLETLEEKYEAQKQKQKDNGKK
ncbi:hypothetical protein WBJ53_26115 [Spirosoma sp. SC4-14]|uniref:hypothetical protein n=1 Tax=Spirosoma sp. SC4-14 TaxID=3128900 RepID=UPI0030D20376